MAKRAWYLLHGKTYLMILLGTLLLAPLIAGAVDAWRWSTVGLKSEKWIMPVRFMSVGLLLFWLCAMIIVAMVSERWQRLVEKQKNPEPERKEI
jgi:hypothetical protein